MSGPNLGWSQEIVTSFATGDVVILSVSAGLRVVAGGLGISLESFSPARDVLIFKTGSTERIQMSLPAQNFGNVPSDPFWIGLYNAPIIGADGEDFIVNKATAQNLTVTLFYQLILI